MNPRSELLQQVLAKLNEAAAAEDVPLWGQALIQAGLLFLQYTIALDEPTM